MESVKKEQKKLLIEEEKIEKETQRLIKMNEDVEKLVKEDIKINREEEAAETKELSFIQKFASKYTKGHKILLAIITSMGVILVWKGLWDLFDTIPLLKASVISLVIGFGILWLFNRYTKI